MNKNSKQIAILASGAFGVALANLFTKMKYNVKLWVRKRDTADLINTFHRFERLGRNIVLDDELYADTDVKSVLEGSDVIISAIVSDKLRSFLNENATLFPKDAIIVSGSKGLEESTCKRMTEIIEEELKITKDIIAVLSGPNLASEIGYGMSSTAVIAAHNKETLKICLDCIHSEYFRIYTSEDVIGVELGGAAKNVIAVASGLCVFNQSRLGTNEMAALATRGAREIKRLGVALGANPDTFFGLSCYGDIIATCTPSSRNYQYGQAIGRGGDPDEVIKNLRGVAEGVISVRALHKLSKKHKVRMPICTAVYGVITKKLGVEIAIAQLMKSGGKSEED